MFTFSTFLTEAAVGGIQHIEHPSDRLFEGPDAAHHALKTLKGVT